MNKINKRPTTIKSAAWVILLVTNLAAALPAPAARAQDGGADLLLAAYLRTQNRIDQLTAALAKLDQDIRADDLTIAKAEKLIAAAREQGNQKVEASARQAQAEVREARSRDEATRARLNIARMRAATTLGRIRDGLAADIGAREGKASPRGIVSDFFGTVRVFKKGEGAVDLAPGGPCRLETGDLIATGESSGAEIQALDGRGTVKLGERSELRLAEDGPDRQVVELLRGGLYSEVDKTGELSPGLLDTAARYRDSLLALPGMAEKEYEALLNRMRAWVNRKFHVSRGGHCGAVRGTKFSVEVKGDETTFAVYEGAVEVGDLKGERTVLVEAGFKVVATKDAVSEPVKITAVDNWWDK